MADEPKAGQPPTPPDDQDAEVDFDADPAGYDDLDDFGGYADTYDTTAAFEDLRELDDLDREPTPALLAAKAEPLAGADPDRRPRRRSSRTGRSKASEAARASKTRASTRRKPKEPSRLWLGAGLAVVLLAGLAVGYVLTRDDGSDDTAAATETETSAPDGEQADGAGADIEEPSTATSEPPPAGPAMDEPPVVIFDQAAVGPVDAGVPYTLAVGNGPPDAQYQLLVDGEAQAEPAPELPPVAFGPGRHLLVVNITSSAGDISTNPVVVYALSETPEATWRANLSSVDIEGEGWAEAVRQFDEYVASGHTELQLMPSERFPALAPGFWNLFVGGFADSAAATAYCEGAGLSVPDQCFPVLADPNATG